MDEEQCPLPKMVGGLDAEVLRRNLQQVVQRTNAISFREIADETGRLVSQGCQTTSTGEILATNIHIGIRLGVGFFSLSLSLSLSFFFS